MNLAAYDVMEYNLNNKTYIRPAFKRLYSNEIEYHKYYCFLDKYDKETNSKDYYIAVFDNYDDKFICRQTHEKSGTTRFDLYSIWNKLKLNTLKETTVINVEEVDRQEDGVVYKLNLGF